MTAKNLEDLLHIAGNPGFAFSYSVRGEYLSGKFFLKANQEQSDELVKTLPWPKVSGSV
jgi:hypothetical protein